MTYRPYPNADRALRQLNRQAQAAPPRQLSELEQRRVQQATAVLAAVGQATQPMREALVQAGAPRSASLSTQILVVAGRRLKEECARSAPGVLALHQMAQAMRRQT